MKPVENIALKIGGEEAGIFEDAEHQEIAGDAEREARQSASAGRSFLAISRQADDVIEGDRGQQQQHELPIADGIEGQRGQRQPDHRRQIAEPAEPK